MDPTARTVLTAMDHIGILFTSYLCFSVAQEVNHESEEKLVAQNAHISTQYKVLQEQHAEINASLRYAQPIQISMMTPGDLMPDRSLERFVYTRQRELVGGDFHLSFRTLDGKVLSAVGDR